jgi:glutaminyl-peptide cyclotransferase
MKPRIFIPAVLFAIIVFAGGFIVYRQMNRPPVVFDRQIAMQHVINQVDLGPRHPGTPGHAEVIQYISDHLNQSGWNVELQQAEVNGLEIQNIVASRDETPAQVILGAHYDTRLYADRDPNLQNQSLPVPGANDGASGVAVLLEIARVLPKSIGGVHIVFFDAEDQGGINGQNWSQGAAAFVESFVNDPDAAALNAVVIIDMIGDADQQVYYEQMSDTQLSQEIWAAAAALGYSNRIIPEVKHNIIDDHVPFLRAGFAAVDMIDIDYTYWHTVDDTPDKVSPESLETIGLTLLKWLADRN